MKKFIVYLMVIIVTVSLGFAVFFLVKDNEVISISNASIYKDVGDKFTLDINHEHKKSYTDITVTSSNDEIVKGKYSEKDGKYSATAVSGGVARINVRTSNVKFRNLWCDVIVGDGSIESPYYISTAEQLAAIGGGKEVSPGVFEGAGEYSKYHSNLCYKLISNINLASYNQGYWVPLKNFNGRLDGNGMTISNVNIDEVGYYQEFGTSATPYLSVARRAGLFDSIGSNGIVYNLKLKNVSATGDYSEFGAVAAYSEGVIERIEVDNLYASVKTSVFGGIVGTIYTNEIKTEELDENNNPIAVYTRKHARIDRCSVNMIVGEKTSIDSTTGDINKSIVGAVGRIGGIVGINNGGTIVYSYSRGTVYLGDDSVNPITYGGIVAENNATDTLNPETNVKDSTKYQGANIKDCYADIVLTVSSTTNNSSKIAGVVGENKDFGKGLYSTTTNQVVNSYLIGNYYNKEKLNYNQSTDTITITKDYQAIASFVVDGKDIAVYEAKTIACGLTNVEMQNYENFVSHITKVIEFNEDGTSKGVVSKNITWLFNTVWAIKDDVNEGHPYLTYQLSYIPDDFKTVGVPLISDSLDSYFYDIEVVYPVSITSGANGILRINKGDYYQLIYSPTGVNMDWTSSDDNYVEVDNQGKVFGKNIGSAIITATNNGSSARIKVIVEDTTYNIQGLPDTIYMTEGESNSNILSNVVITPNVTPTYSIEDASGNPSTIAKIVGKIITAQAQGEAILRVTVGSTSVTSKLVINPAGSLVLSVDKNYITGDINTIQKTGVINISNNQSIDIPYIANSKDDSIVKVEIKNKNQLHYTIVGTGVTSVIVHVKDIVYSGSIVVNFNIVSGAQNVTLTASPSNIDGYIQTMNKIGSVTITNSLNQQLEYLATTSDSSIVATTVVGNSINYEIKKIGDADITISVVTTGYAGTIKVHFNIKDFGNAGTNVEYINLQSTANVSIGEELNLSVSGNYTSLTWTSSDENIVYVYGDGIVRGLQIGTAKVIATTSSGVSAECEVTVDTGIVKLNVSPLTATIYQGESLQLTATGNYKTIDWSVPSRYSDLLSVNNNGLVVAGTSKTGTGVIYVKAQDDQGKYANLTITLKVEPKLVSIKLTADNQNIMVGQSVLVNAALTGSGSFDWVYDNTVAAITPVSTTQIRVEATENSIDKITKTGTIVIGAKSGNVSSSVTISVTENKAYSKEIWNLSQLNAVRYHLDKDFYIMSDIEVGDWTPIGTKDKPFTGSIVGVSGTLTKINCSDSNIEYAGLFGYVDGATISNITVKDSTFNGINVGSIIGGGNATIENCYVTNSQISANTTAGGIAGILDNMSVSEGNRVKDCDIMSTSINSGLAYVGGIVGKLNDSVLNNGKVLTTSIKHASSAHGYVGGIVGYNSNSGITNVTADGIIIQANTTDTDYAGGISGYVFGDKKTQIKNSIVANASISGYNVGGIAGAMNITTSVYLKFSTTNSGYRFSDLDKDSKDDIGNAILASNSNINANLKNTISVSQVAIKDTVKVKGTIVGGFFATLNSGIVVDSYTRATLEGTSKNSSKAGFAVQINATGYDKNGIKATTGNAGVIINCYSVSSFKGSGDNYLTTASFVHDSNNSIYGFVMNYLVEDTTGGKAIYYTNKTLWGKDQVSAKKSEADMKLINTYLDKDFDNATWNLSNNDYATLKFEK